MHCFVVAVAQRIAGRTEGHALEEVAIQEPCHVSDRSIRHVIVLVFALGNIVDGSVAEMTAMKKVVAGILAPVEVHSSTHLVVDIPDTADTHTQDHHADHTDHIGSEFRSHIAIVCHNAHDYHNHSAYHTLYDHSDSYRNQNVVAECIPCSHNVHMTDFHGVHTIAHVPLPQTVVDIQMLLLFVLSNHQQFNDTSS